MAAFIISIVALVVALMALPTVAQMIWGKPNLSLDFEDRVGEGGKVMVCKIFNLPIKNRLLRKIGVRTTVAEGIIAHFEIKVANTDEVIYPGVVPHIITYDGNIKAQRVNLAASVFNAFFRIVSVQGNKVTVFGEEIVLIVGRYTVFAEITSERNITKAKKDIVVTNKIPYAYWE
ncbi:hypothetical protein ACFLXD_07320 [Chloroflexota bacterium]